MVAEQKASGRRLAVLDIDGTLTDTIPLHHTAFLAAMESFAFPNLDRNWAGYTHHTDTAIFEEAWQRAHGINDTLDQRAAFHARLEDEFARTSAGVTIRKIAGPRRSCKLCETEVGRSFLRRVNCANSQGRSSQALEYLSWRRSWSRHPSMRPVRELVAPAIVAAHEFYGFEAIQIICIGDGIWGFKTARALNLSFLGVGTGAKADELRNLGATVVSDFQDIATIFAALDRNRLLCQLHFRSAPPLVSSGMSECSRILRSSCRRRCKRTNSLSSAS